MTAAREAIALPLVFLTVLLLGSLRIDGRVELAAPTPYLLVLGVLLIRLAVQSGTLAPEQLMSSSRPALAIILLVNTGAAAPDRPRLLRSLAVTFGATFILKFVVLHGLSAPSEGPIKRALQALLDGVTVGVLMQEVPDPVAPYLALLTVGLFLVGLVLLPHRGGPATSGIVRTAEATHPTARGRER
jgi:hypothetical protein